MKRLKDYIDLDPIIYSRKAINKRYPTVKKKVTHRHYWKDHDCDCEHCSISQECRCGETR